MGAAIVAKLRSAGARVLTTARTQTFGASEDDFIAADASTAAGCALIADAVKASLGGIDIIVHNVGGSTASAADSLLWTMKDGSRKWNST